MCHHGNCEAWLQVHHKHNYSKTNHWCWKQKSCFTESTELFDTPQSSIYLPSWKALCKQLHIPRKCFPYSLLMQALTRITLPTPTPQKNTVGALRLRFLTRNINLQMSWNHMLGSEVTLDILNARFRWQQIGFYFCYFPQGFFAVYFQLLFIFHTLYEFRFSDWLICTTWYWVVAKQPPWRHYRGVKAFCKFNTALSLYPGFGWLKVWLFVRCRHLFSYWWCNS